MFTSLFSLLSDWVLIFALHLSVNNFPPVLSAAEESECFEKMWSGDKSARDKLISRNLRLVAHVTKKYYAGVTEQDDLISIGTIGLIKAVNTYSRLRNCRFATYAAKCIQNEVLMFLRKNIKCKNDSMLNDPLESDSDGSSLTIMDILFDEEEVHSAIENNESTAALGKALTKLSPRERKIIELRYGLGGREPLTQYDVSEKLGISRSYVSRIETHSLAVLKNELKSK